MPKRTLLILLIVGAIAAVLAVIIFILKPFGDLPGQQPPPLPERVERTFEPSDAVPKPPAPSPAPDVNDPAERERQAQEAMKRQGMDFAGRVGSYSSVDNFAALRDVYALVTDEYRAKLEVMRADLIKQYPSFGTSWGRTYRPLTTKILSGTPVLSSSRVVVEVQGQLIIERAGENPVVSNVKSTITFVKQGTNWIVSDVTEATLEL